MKNLQTKAVSILTTATALSPYQSSYVQHLPTKQKQPMICFILFCRVCDACSTQSSHTTGGLSSCEDLIYWRRYSNEPHPKKTWTWTSQTRKTSIWGQIEKNTKKTVGYGKTTLKPPLGLLPHNHHLKSITKQYHGSMLFDIPTNWLVHRYPYNYNGSGIIPI